MFKYIYLIMSKEKNELMNSTFESLSVEKKKELLCINDNVLSSSRFKGLDVNVVINDLWNGKTNAQKRIMLKTV